MAKITDPRARVQKLCRTLRKMYPDYAIKIQGTVCVIIPDVDEPVAVCSVAEAIDALGMPTSGMRGEPSIGNGSEANGGNEAQTTDEGTEVV